MKKLSLLLLTIFVSLMGWAATFDPDADWDYLNPYAYDLKSEVINEGQTLRLTYKFNAPGFNNSDDYNLLNPKTGGTGRGIQIYLLYKDNEGNFQRVKKDDGTEYKITSGGYNEAKTWSVDVNIIDIPDNCKGKELTWEAVVHGNIGRTKPKLVKATTTKPTNAYGIAVNNDPTHVRFAQMFVSEAYPKERDGSKVDGWKKWGETDDYKYANTMLEYTPLLGFQCAHFKHYHNDNEKAHFASLWDWTNKYGDLTITSTYSYNYEPNRIKVSEDGRTFVSSFHPQASCAVLEYGKNRDEYNGHHFYNTIDNNWENNKDLDNISDKVDGNYNPFLYRRCVGMDVKGKGDNLKIILLWIDANAAKYTISGKTVPAAKFIIYEYELGLAEAEGYIATNKYLPPFDDTGCKYVHKIGEYSWDYQGWSSGGAFYQGARYGTLNNNNKRYLYNNMLRGFADLAYGTNDDVWVKIDYCAEIGAKPKIIRVKLNNGTTTEYTINGSTANYGGSGILIKDGMLITSPTNSTICLYEINANGELNATDKQPNAKHTIIDDQIGSWVTGFATDYAGNLFALTQASINGENYTANILGIAMPYKKAITTRAKGTFTLSAPIPNILATNLKYEPAGTTDNYTFSFITNTKPSIAEIRFYRKENLVKMENNITTIHADNYQKGQAGHETLPPDYVYTFTENQRQRGLMSVTLRMVGGDAKTKQITNALPPGEMYWSVYVETDKSSCFAPIYRSGFHASTSNYEPLHATVNNYPATDMFGSLIVTNNNEWNTEERPTNGLLIYGLNPNGGNSTEDTYANSNRFVKKAEYLNQNNKGNTFLHYPRRMTVAPDGKVYIADEGHFKGKSNGTNYKKSMHAYGGVKLWDPTKPSDFTLFSDNRINTSTGLALYQRNNSMRLYVSNTYDEFKQHIPWGDYSKENQTDVGQYGWNGFVEYVVDKYTSNEASWDDFWSEENRAKEYALCRGDESGNMSLVAIEQGVWLCQYKDQNWDVKKATFQPLPDNLGSFVLSFVPYDRTESRDKYGLRTWSSCTTDGIKNPESDRTPDSPSELTQTSTSLLQSTPGAGMAYRKTNGKEYLYVVNHNGNIVRLEITSWSGTGVNATPSLPIENVKVLLTPSNTKHTKDVIQGNYTTQWKNYAFINSMEFDYAGNLVTVTGDGMSHNAKKHEIIVYTMPYDRTNAQEIRASDSQYYIPERISQTYDKHGEIITPYLPNSQGGVNKGTCGLDIFRPMLSGSFNTICLPFDLASLEGTPYEGATVMEYTGASYRMQNGEGMVDLNFEQVTKITAGEPYLIQLGTDNQGKDKKITGIVRFDQIQFATTTPDPKDLKNVTGITLSPEPKAMYQGIFDKKSDWDDEDLPALILVDQNRLAEVFSSGTMQGFRGYFRVTDMPSGTTYSISSRKPIATGLVDHKGRPINIEKYLREGHVYIRVGDTLYTLDGKRL